MRNTRLDEAQAEIKIAGKIPVTPNMQMTPLLCQKIWKTQQWPQDWKTSVFIPIPKKGNAKECSNYHTIALISPTAR